MNVKKLFKTALTGALALTMVTAVSADTHALSNNTTTTVTAVTTNRKSYYTNLTKTLLKKAISAAVPKKVLNATGDTADGLATELTNIITEVDWSDPATIPTAVSQLNKAIQATDGGLAGLSKITAKDISEWKNDITSVYQYKGDYNEETTVSTIQDIAVISSLPSTDSQFSNGYPIGIGKVTVKGGKYGNGKEATMVILTGTSFVEGQSSGVITDLLSGCEGDSVYLESAIKAVTENVPAGSDIIISGFSLGGMIAQQLMVQPVIYSNYNVIEVTSLGAPALMVDQRTDAFRSKVSQSSIHRVISYYDLVPYMSVDYFTDADYLDGQIPKEGTVYETLKVEYEHNYKTGFSGTHALGYMQDEVWKNYDVFGYDTRVEDAHTIDLTLADFTYYGSDSVTSGKLSILE